MTRGLSSQAVVFEQPGQVVLKTLELDRPGDSDLVVEIEATGISTGTEKLLWNGTMPAFPGLAYPLVPGYEAVGVVSHSGAQCRIKEGERVFVPGASCYGEAAYGVFGGSASRLVVSAERVTPVGDLQPEQATLLALAATAMHVLTYQIRQQRPGVALTCAELIHTVPDLIVGHGVLGRLLARLCVAIGAEAPVVHEINPQRCEAEGAYVVLDPQHDKKTDYRHIADVSGGCDDHFNRLIARLSRAGRLTLAGFYNAPVNFDFAPAFMREITVGIAAEWVPDDLSLVLSLLESGALSLDALISHRYPFEEAAAAYSQAFTDPACLKMILNWSA